MSKQSTGVGILGIGLYLPPGVRKNSDLPAHIVDGWRKRLAQSAGRQAEQDLSGLGAGARHTAAGMKRLISDPFQGTSERRVAAPDQSATEMGALAAEEALKRAGLRAADIDLILTWDAVPDVPHVASACLLHQRLGLPSRCFSLSVEAACNAFNMQASIANRMIQSGQARHALLVQVNNFQRVTPLEETVSLVFGDGATAVVLGPVSAGRGILAESHRTDSYFTRTLAISPPGRPWYEEGRSVLHSPDKMAAHRMLLSVADFGKEVIIDALASAHLSAGDVDFFACHQGAAWLRGAVQQHAGLEKARAVDTFAWTASLGGANITAVMAVGEREGMLRDGDCVATFAGGTGVTYSSLVLRWGR
ncbi:MAG: 3-oxoacyl-ACP synthase III family protein [Deltaproteobacteria bacterium]|nr:3-oxoacyl-ACP synthase III family protein [Deltaproteobacteria bacterium]